MLSSCAGRFHPRVAWTSTVLNEHLITMLQLRSCGCLVCHYLMPVGLLLMHSGKPSLTEEAK